MADWRNIQGKIRKARTSSDPPGQLAALYQSTKDAMVAFELARLHEKAGSNAEAAHWYLTASEKFRRAQWKAKAQEALLRLGVETPLAATEAAALAGEHNSAPSAAAESAESDGAESSVGNADAESPTEFSEAVAEPESDNDAPQPDSDMGPEVTTGETVAGTDAPTVAGAAKRRRRGRRGGRGRRKGPRAAQEPAAAGAAAPPTKQDQSQSRRRSSPEVAPAPPAAPVPQDSVAGKVGPAAWQARRHAAEPALASRLAQLESKLRRMLAAPPVTLGAADRAPAGPGVFVLSDSELIDHYYVEACQTLRIGVGNLARSGKAVGGGAVKSRLADHLGINETQASKYLKEHCAIRWLQLDDDAPQLAHYAIAVLRPALNE
jgi:hypothetical protein